MKGFQNLMESYIELELFTHKQRERSNEENYKYKQSIRNMEM